jgi:type VI secretion system Hcp family effector
MLQVSNRHYFRALALLMLLILSTVAAIAQSVPYKYEVEWTNLGGAVQTFPARKFELGIGNESTGGTGGGGGTGRPTFSPVRMVKEWDGNSPLIAKAVATGQHFQKVVLRFFKYDKKGTQALWQEVTLEDVIVTNWQQIGADVDVHTLGLNANFGTVHETNELESVSLAYRKITVKNLPAGTQFSFDLATGF